MKSRRKLHGHLRRTSSLSPLHDDPRLHVQVNITSEVYTPVGGTFGTWKVYAEPESVKA